LLGYCGLIVTTRDYALLALVPLWDEHQTTLACVRLVRLHLVGRLSNAGAALGWLGR